MSDVDLDTLAARMFGATTPTVAKVATPRQATTADQTAARFYDQPVPRVIPDAQPDATAPKTDDQIAEALFADSPVHGDAERVIKAGVMDVDLIPPEEADAIVSEWVPVFQEYGLSASESRLVAEVGISAYTTPPDEATTQRWIDDTRAVLQQDYPAHEIAGVLKDAQTLVGRNPRVKAWLEATGMGNHPQLVRIVARKAYEARRAGKL